MSISMTINNAHNIQQATIKGILCRNNSILFVKDTKGHWELPGGRIEFGEEPKQSLQREFMEELGAQELKIGEVVDVWSFISEKSNIKRHFIVIVYCCNSPQENFNSSSNEHLEYRFVPFTEIDNLDTRQGYKDSVEKYIALIHTNS